MRSLVQRLMVTKNRMSQRDSRKTRLRISSYFLEQSCNINARYATYVYMKKQQSFLMILFFLYCWFWAPSAWSQIPLPQNHPGLQELCETGVDLATKLDQRSIELSLFQLTKDGLWINVDSRTFSSRDLTPYVSEQFPTIPHFRLNALLENDSGRQVQVEVIVQKMSSMIRVYRFIQNVSPHITSIGDSSMDQDRVATSPLSLSATATLYGFVVRCALIS